MEKFDKGQIENEIVTSHICLEDSKIK